MYNDFRTRYAILAPKEAHKAMKAVKRPVTDEKKNIAAAHAVMEKIEMSLEKFGYGHTKVRTDTIQLVNVLMMLYTCKSTAKGYDNALCAHLPIL
jgi:myosin heavy subunit